MQGGELAFCLAPKETWFNPISVSDIICISFKLPPPLHTGIVSSLSPSWVRGRTWGSSEWDDKNPPPLPDEDLGWWPLENSTVPQGVGLWRRNGGNMKRRDFQQDAIAWKCCWFIFVLKWRVLFFWGGKGGVENCPRNIPSVGIFRESPELRKVQVKKEKSAYNNFVYNDWTTINPQATVQTRCLQSVRPLPAPAGHELRPAGAEGKPLPHLTQRRQSPSLLSTRSRWHRHPQRGGGGNDRGAGERSQGWRCWHWRNPWNRDRWARIRVKPPPHRCPGQLSGLFAGQIAATLLCFRSCQNKVRLETCYCSLQPLKTVHICTGTSVTNGQMCGRITVLQLLSKNPTAKHFLKTGPEKQVRLQRGLRYHTLPTHFFVALLALAIGPRRWPTTPPADLTLPDPHSACQRFKMPHAKESGEQNWPDIMLALLTGVLPPGMLDEPIRAWSFTMGSRKSTQALDTALPDSGWCADHPWPLQLSWFCQAAHGK